MARKLTAPNINLQAKANEPEMSNNRKWWLNIGDTVDGPRGEAYIVAAIQSGHISVQTMACIEGETDWCPISSWPEFASNPYVPPPHLSSVGEGMLTNDKLPKVANWICIYCLVGSPILLVVSEGVSFLEMLMTLATTTPLEVILSFLSAVCSFAVTVALFVGGMRLRQLRLSGVTLIRLALWASLILGSIFMVLLFLAGLMAPDEEGDVPSLVLAGFCLLLPLALAELAFMVGSLIWLTQHTRELPLDPNR